LKNEIKNIISKENVSCRGGHFEEIKTKGKMYTIFITVTSERKKIKNY